MKRRADLVALNGARDRGIVQVARASTQQVCRACGARYAEGEWLALPVSERIGAGDVGRLVRGWPEGLCIEVRGCGRCGHTIAAKREVRTA